MLRLTIIVVLCLIFALPASATQELKLTQRDLMFGLVEGLGWSFGLPDQPEESDYQKILNGQRKLRIEIETSYDTVTRVIVEGMFAFGNYSGQGWVRAPNYPSDIPVRFNLPLSGEYRVKARLLKQGHTLRIGDKQFLADGGDRLADVELGKVYLQAGEQKVFLAVPARGGIDFIELEALPLPAIAPNGGWNLDAQLSFDDLAVTAIQILGLHSTLPDAGKSLILEVENFPLPKNTHLSTNRHLGVPSEGKWVSVGADPVTLNLDVAIPATGVYDISVRCVGKAEISGLVNTQPIQISPDGRFADKQAGGVVLQKGQNPFSFQIPPHCGIDQIILSPQASTLEDFRRLTGLPRTGTPSSTQLNSFLKLLAAFGATR